MKPLLTKVICFIKQKKCSIKFFNRGKNFLGRSFSKSPPGGGANRITYAFCIVCKERGAEEHSADESVATVVKLDSVKVSRLVLVNFEPQAMANNDIGGIPLTADMDLDKVTFTNLRIGSAQNVYRSI